jgi:hypothetical protein
MRRWLEICGLLVIFLLPVSLKGQLLCIDTLNGRSREGDCTCEDEKVTPNLTIAKPVKLTGSLSDATGAPIQFSGTTIQVRDPLKGKVLFSAILDQQGRFDLGIVPAGSYRLVAFRKEGKKVRRLPTFDQPKPEYCSSENECKLEIVLTMHGSDQPFEFCPPK